MRVSCSTLDDFLANMECGDLPLKIVFCERTRRPLGESVKPVRWAVMFSASTVVERDSVQYLVQYGESCGVDYEDATQDRGGSEQADELRHRLASWCESKGVRLLPGVLDA